MFFSHSFAWWRCFLLDGVKGQWPNHPQRGYLGKVNSDRFLSGFWTHLTDENQDYHHIIDHTYSLWNFEDLLKYCNIWTWLFQISMKSVFNSKYMYIFILYLLIFTWSNSKLSKYELGWPSWLSHHKLNSWLNPWLAIYGSLHPGKGFKPNFHCFFSFFCLMEVFSTCSCEGTVTKSSTKRLPGQG